MPPRLPRLGVGPPPVGARPPQSAEGAVGRRIGRTRTGQPGPYHPSGVRRHVPARGPAPRLTAVGNTGSATPGPVRFAARRERYARGRSVRNDCGPGPPTARRRGSSRHRWYPRASGRSGGGRYRSLRARIRGPVGDPASLGAEWPGRNEPRRCGRDHLAPWGPRSTRRARGQRPDRSRTCSAAARERTPRTGHHRALPSRRGNRGSTCERGGTSGGTRREPHGRYGFRAVGARSPAASVGSARSRGSVARGRWTTAAAAIRGSVLPRTGRSSRGHARAGTAR